MKEEKPKIAICYDFDKTLSPDDMQAQGFIQSVNYDVKSFWEESNKLARDNEMDQNLAYMYMMSKGSYGNFVFNKEKLQEFGSKVSFFPGVGTWFDRINKYAENLGITVEHYIISSGLKEMIEGTSIADKFKRIYASSFFFDEKGVAVWPAQAVNYTNKTQFLFRIEKGVLDVNDQQVNTYFKQSELHVPFRNMVYIGDSDTDIPCMKLVNTNGGHSIGVYNPETKDKSKVYKMLDENRIKYFVPADYSENSELEKLVKEIIDRTKTNEILEKVHYCCIDEKDIDEKSKSSEEKEKEDLINQLEASSNFKRTHDIVAELKKVSEWNQKQKDKLIKIGLSNSQVEYILSDYDIRTFFDRIIDGNEGDEANQIREEMK